MTELSVLILGAGTVISFILAAILIRIKYGHVRGHLFGMIIFGLAFGFFIFLILGMLSVALYGYSKEFLLFEIVAMVYLFLWNPGHKTNISPETWQCHQCSHKPRKSWKFVVAKKDGRVIGV